MNIEEALFKLDDFCNVNKIEYMVTGTVALSILGVPSNPDDIDIKVFNLKEEQEAKLNELQFLSGLGKENYKAGECFSFLIKGIKINVLVNNIENYDETTSQGVTVDLIDKAQAKYHSISIQMVFPALMDKMRLRRDKDKTYMLNLINKLTSL